MELAERLDQRRRGDVDPAFGAANPARRADGWLINTTDNKIFATSPRAVLCMTRETRRTPITRTKAADPRDSADGPRDRRAGPGSMVGPARP